MYIFLIALVFPLVYASVKDLPASSDWYQDEYESPGLVDVDGLAEQSFLKTSKGDLR
jgi:hypothetical protein